MQYRTVKTINAKIRRSILDTVVMAVFILSILYCFLYIRSLLISTFNQRLKPVEFRSRRFINLAEIKLIENAPISIFAFNVSETRYCKNFFTHPLFRADALSFILFTRFFNGRSCANVACNLCWRLSYGCLFPLLFWFFFFCFFLIATGTCEEFGIQS